MLVDITIFCTDFERHTNFLMPISVMGKVNFKFDMLKTKVLF